MSVKVEMLIRMNVSGTWRYPGEVVEVSESDAADMVALWQAKRLPALLVQSARSMVPESDEQPEVPSAPPALRPPRGKYRSRDIRVSR